MPRYSRFGSQGIITPRSQETPVDAGMRDISLNYLELGQTGNQARTATIDCAFRNRDSTWGKASGEGAGILILHVTLAQPAGYKLRNATMNLYLLADDSDNLGSCPSATDVAPRRVCGLSSETEVNTGLQVQPDVAVGNLFTIGGVGYTNAKKYLERHWWLFETARLPDSRRNYTRAQFTWEANPDKNQNERCGPLMVALGIRHSERPFLIGFEIEGRLNRRLSKYKYSGRALTRLRPINDGNDIERLMTLTNMEAKTKDFNTSDG
jgi:hypothetical protein